jgi:broad specificity phosphatase PhoE
MPLTDLYLIRHGHPQLGTGIAYDRPPGPPLSEVGLAEARLAGLYLAGRGIQRLYASPLERALGTAQAIGAEIGAAPAVDEALAEHRADETFDGVTRRLSAFLNRLRDEPADRVALVTHGSPIKAALHILTLGRIDLTGHVYSNGNHAPTAGIWHARSLDGVWHLELAFKPAAATPPAHVMV